MGFSGQEHWSGLPFPPPGAQLGLPSPGLCVDGPGFPGRLSLAVLDSHGLIPDGIRTAD